MSWPGQAVSSTEKAASYVDGSRPSALRLQLMMTDEDAVRRFHEAMGGIGSVRYSNPPSFQALGRKPMWRWRVVNFEGVQAALAFLWYGLSRRRKDTARHHLNHQPRSSL